MSLLLIAHGSPDSRHREAVNLLAANVADASGWQVRVGFLEHDEPSVTDILGADSAAGPPANPVRCVGLFLSDGYHTQVDVPAVLRSAQVPVVDCGTLGMGLWLLPALERALAALNLPLGNHHGVALTAAGSTRPQARDEVFALAAAWQRQPIAPVRAAFLSGGGPTVDEALCMLSDSGADQNVVVTLMLAPGVLSDRVHDVADQHGLPVTPALLSGDDAATTEIVTRILDCAGADQN